MIGALPTARAAPDPITLTIDPEPYRLYRESMARNEPETVALIGGRLEEPTHITDFFFLPPSRQDGGFDHGAAHIAIDAPAMNFLIDRVLARNDKYMLGLWHTHPGAHIWPSGPDLHLCANILRNDDSPGRRWKMFLAPITTFEPDGRDRVTAWVLRKGAAAFERAAFVPPGCGPPVSETPRLVPPHLLVGAPPATETPPLDAVRASTEASTDPLAAEAARLARLLDRPDGPCGVPRYRAGVHLRAALTIAEADAARAPRP